MGSKKIGEKRKTRIISFGGTFHERTLGAQMIEGIPSLKKWIVTPDPDVYQLPLSWRFWM